MGKNNNSEITLAQIEIFGIAGAHLKAPLKGNKEPHLLELGFEGKRDLSRLISDALDGTKDGTISKGQIIESLQRLALRTPDLKAQLTTDQEGEESGFISYLRENSNISPDFINEIKETFDSVFEKAGSNSKLSKKYLNAVLPSYTTPLAARRSGLYTNPVPSQISMVIKGGQQQVKRTLGLTSLENDGGMS